jgi:preprotein translocase subunit SecG
MVILLQQGKGGDIAAAFGGGSSQAAFGARSGATVLSRATAICFALFLAGALGLSILAQLGPSSVIGRRPAPATPTSPALPSAPTPKPPVSTPPPASSAPAPAAETPAPGPVEKNQTPAPAPDQKK